MWPFRRRQSKEDFQGYKRVTINGMRFTIRRLNPLLDFSLEKMPQIFSDYLTRRVQKEDKVTTLAELKRQQDDMLGIIRAGVVEPKLSEDGISAADLFRDPTLGPKLYIEILAHSLSLFRGIKGVFFYQKIKWSLWIQWLKGMETSRRILPSTPQPQ